MTEHNLCFTSFKSNIEHYQLPTRFTFPFCYEPHPLCLLASEELQQQLQDSPLLQNDDDNVGKMFGVLLVENEEGSIGYLSAYSGKQVTQHSAINFVPAIVDINSQTDFYRNESDIINRINRQVDALLSKPDLENYQQGIKELTRQQDNSLTEQHAVMAGNRKIRKAKRIKANAELSSIELAQSLKLLAQESVDDKNKLRDLKVHWRELIAQTQVKLTQLTDEITALKNQRKRLSTKLQKKIFKQYRMLNSAGIEKDVVELFQQTPFPIPPAGTGDCAAPKLLQYAFQHGFTPLAMAEFWWGNAPKSELRQHKNFYGACSGKCQPLLTHMLEGITLDDNPLLINPAKGKVLPIVYQDEYMVVVNKPNEFLSVPGKHIQDSVYARIKQQFPEATGTLIVHRLDMSTSGLMVLALTKRVQKHLQQQFVNRTIKKRYVATLEGDIASSTNGVEGEVNLPMRGDLEDRPRQLVCFTQGKHAKTQWKIISTIAGKTKLYLYPETGRTHQLRVHCAHPEGLNIPILGDDLYGHNSEHGDDMSNNHRLHLHAQQLTLSHPISKETITFEIDSDF